MSFARVTSAQPVYLDAILITVEADVSKGLHSFQVVGLADKAIDESRERVAAAIKNSGFTSPKHSNKRVVVSLAPADVKKEGPRFDLSIALAYLLANKEVDFDPSGIVFIGELSLTGELRPVRGALSIARFAQQQGMHTVVVPQENAEEAALIRGITILPAATLSDVIHHFSPSSTISLPSQSPTMFHTDTNEVEVDFFDIRGQETAKRGLEIAASGRHNVVLYGPPGTGKTLLAKAMRGILPTLSFEEALETTAIHSLTGQLQGGVISTPPFRSPHHSASHVSIVGGGSIPHPGEATLAHRGVLFLDEFPEFERRVIDGLREPLENRTISVSRAKGSVTFPANFILVAAMNPTRERGEQRMSDLDREQLKKRISGPVVDRIDMWIEVPHIDYDTLRTKNNEGADTSAIIRDRVVTARAIQTQRFTSETKTNSDMSVRDIDTYAYLSPQATDILTASSKRYNLSPRSYHRTIKLARTIADLSKSGGIEQEHILEALAYRPKDLFE